MAKIKCFKVTLVVDFIMYNKSKKEIKKKWRDYLNSFDKNVKQELFDQLKLISMEEE